ncbi:MAG: hypothetical protein P8Z37_05270 [Acidobacteriota bacterium]
MPLEMFGFLDQALLGLKGGVIGSPPRQIGICNQAEDCKIVGLGGRDAIGQGQGVRIGAFSQPCVLQPVLGNLDVIRMPKP